MRFAVSFRGEDATVHTITIDAIDEAEAIALVRAALWPDVSFDDFAAELIDE